MAGKAKLIYFCKECGFESSKWLGQCPGCKQWNTFVEEPNAKPLSARRQAVGPGAAAPVPQRLAEVAYGEQERKNTGIGELDRVLGGGIVAGS